MYFLYLFFCFNLYFILYILYILYVFYNQIFYFILRYSGNVVLAAILAVVCSLRFASESEAEEMEDISGMLKALAGHRSKPQ